ncbi:MAG: tetratricopeptide repeat protein [Vicinamibacteria bacterium]|nr:tetratricopeptide repeat protein [Vicinamibacteria bacterium]
MGKKRTRRAQSETEQHPRPLGARRSVARDLPKSDASPRRAEQALSPARRWLFRGVIVVTPWLLLLLLEISLRAFGYGVPMNFTLRRDVAGESRFLSNPYFTWLFFEPNAARLCPPFSLSAGKAPNTCRVFVLGSSAAQGDPEPGFGMARMLDVLLSHQYPGVDFEVINAAPTAINSHVVYRMARACSSLAPDIFVVYAGNNEVVGPYGAGTVLTTAAPNLTALRAGVALRATRLGQLTKAAIHETAGMLGRDGSRETWRGMEMFVDHQVRHDDPSLQRTYRRFERNLADIARISRRTGFPLVLSTVAVNLRSCAPFGSLNATARSEEKRRRWNEIYREGIRRQQIGSWAEATRLFQQAAEIDADHAELHYRLGRCAWKLERHEEAGRSYRRARDLDTLRFRADSRINAIIRDVARRETAGGVRLVDAERWMEGHAPHGTPGEETFLDHVHLNVSGNYLVSLAILDELRRALPTWVRRKDSGKPSLSEDECARRLVFTDLDRYMLAETMLRRLREPPFTGQMDHSTHVRRFSREIETLKTRSESENVSLALEKYERTLSDRRAHWSIRERYAAIQQRIGNLEIAAREWRALIDRFPQYPSFHLQLARALRGAGRYADAEASFRVVLDYQPESTLALVEMAKTALLRGKTREAVEHSRRAVDLDPGDSGARYVLATSLCRQNECALKDRAEAIDHLTRALAIAPDSDSIRRDLTRALARQAQEFLAQGNSRRAISFLDRALEITPDMAEAHENLGLIYYQLDEREKAVRHLSAALQSDPGRERARRALESLRLRRSAVPR